MALAVRVLHGTASSPNTIGRVLVHLVMLSRASGSRFLVDPEEVFSRSAMANGAELPPAPRPQPQPEKLVHTDRGVMLSTPLSSGDLAKAMKYAATMKCSNTCPTSYDGVCSDGAMSVAFCSGATAFGAAGRGTCAVAESSDCELGSDCALRPALPNAIPPAPPQLKRVSPWRAGWDCGERQVVTPPPASTPPASRTCTACSRCALRACPWPPAF
jgi:hypothetical protein